MERTFNLELFKNIFIWSKFNLNAPHKISHFKYYHLAYIHPLHFCQYLSSAQLIISSKWSHAVLSYSLPPLKISKCRMSGAVTYIIRTCQWMPISPVNREIELDHMCFYNRVRHLNSDSKWVVSSNREW